VSIYSIYFTPKKSETLSGRPMRNQITGKVKPIDPSIKEYHTSKPEDIETFKATNEYKQKLYEWKVNQQRGNQYQNCNNSSSTKYIDATQTSYDVTDSRNPILEQIPSNIEYIKAGLMEIKNALKISTNSLDETGA
jgi:hypothetical protein